MSEHRASQDQGGDSKDSFPKEKPSAPMPPITRALLILCFLLLGLLAYFARSAGKPQLAIPQRMHPSRPETLDSREPYFSGKSGPWGDLEYARIMLEPPAEFVVSDKHAFGKTCWRFDGRSKSDVAGFFRQCGLSESEVKQLSAPEVMTEESGNITVRPPDDLVLGLGDSSRTRIYASLAENEQNEFHCWPFKFRKGAFDEWFAQSGLSSNSVALVRRLCYERGESLCFSDLPLAFPRMNGDKERERLVRTLARTATLLMKLRVEPGTDVDRLASYWAKGRRFKDVRVLLESLAHVPGGMTLDVAHLLPPFARKHLNTFPDPSTDGTANAADCYWSAMNFFRDPAEDRFHQQTAWVEELQKNYELVEQPGFGDLVFMVRPDGLPIHVAVYIADDVLFTKNGTNARQPWMLVKWEDLKAGYPENYQLHYTVYRAKQPQE